MKALLLASLLLGVITLSQEEKCAVETSMSASMSRDVSIGGPAGHCESHTSASVSKSVGPGKCSMSASVSRDVAISTANSNYAAHCSKSVSQSVTKGHQSYSESASKQEYCSGPRGRKATSFSKSISMYKSQGYYKMSKSVSNGMLLSRENCFQTAHNSLSMSQTVDGSRQSTSISDNRRAHESGSWGSANAYTSVSLKHAATKNHAEISGSVRHTYSNHMVGGHQRAIGGGSMAASMGCSHQSLDTSVSIDIQDAGGWGQNTVHTSASISQSLSENNMGTSCASISHRGTYGYRSCQTVV